MTALITGIAGMVGSHMSDYLIAEGVKTVGIYYNPTVALQHVNSTVILEECDVRDSLRMFRLINQHRPQTIYHLAAQSLPTTSWTRPAETLDINITGTVNVFEAVKLVREREPDYDPVVVVACSSAEYGASLTPENVPITEDQKLLPLSPYGVSKVAQDLLAYQYFQSDGIKSIRVRIFNTTGPRKSGDAASDFVARAVEVEAGRATSIRVGNLLSRRAITDVRDLVRAMILLAKSGVPGEVYNVCGRNAYAMQEVLDMIRGLCKAPLPIVEDPALLRPTDEPIIFGDTTKLVARTGWRQEIPLEKTLSDMMDFRRSITVNTAAAPRDQGTTVLLPSIPPASPSSSSASAEYGKKLSEEVARFAKEANVHDLPEIFHYWSNKYLRPMCEDAGYKNIQDFFVKKTVEAAEAGGSNIARFVSIGSGNCEFEVGLTLDLAQQLGDRFSFECIDLNKTMLERGKQLASERGVLHLMKFVAADFNSWRANDQYDSIVAHQSLHHVTNLEHLYDQVKSALKESGVFLTSDMIGRNGHQRWPEALEIVQRFWSELPDKRKYNYQLQRLEPWFTDWDCSSEGFEGIRAQEVLPLLLERLHADVFIAYGNVIDVFIDRAFGHHLNPDDEADRRFIDQVHETDEELIQGGQIKPTHLIGSFKKSPAAKPHYSRGISPQHAVRRPYNS